jgi:hypothetical protein
VRRRAAVPLLTLAAATTAARVRGQPVDTLLRDLGGGGGSAGVRVTGRLERDGAAVELVITLTAEGGARLVADPGIQVVPLPGPDGPWTETARVELVDPASAYLEPTVELRLPVTEGASGEASAEVAYAWCAVERICLFGQAHVSVPLAGGGD